MTKLKPIAPYMIGQVVGYVTPPKLYCCSGGDWYVVNTAPRHEVLAKGEIADTGLVVYLPLNMVRENGRGRLMRTVERPMFPSYLFVRCERSAEQLAAVKSARGVHRVLAVTGEITEGMIEVIRLHEAEAAQAQPQRKSGLIWHFSPQESVRIKSGPFMGFYALLKSAVDKHDRVKALLNVMGRDSVLNLSAHDIEEASM